MVIEPVAYLEWAKLHEKKRINLSRSGLPDKTLADLGLDPLAGLKITGPNAYGHPELVGALRFPAQARPESSFISVTPMD